MNKAIILLICGIILIVIGFVYKPITDLSSIASFIGGVLCLSAAIPSLKNQ